MTLEHSDKSHQHDTPRTDALLLEIHEGRVYEHHGSMVEHARQLERELAERDTELFRYREEEADRDRRAESIAPTSTRRTTNPADILIYWCQRCGHENTVRLEAPQSPKALAPSARLTSQSYTAQDLQGWIDLLEMFSESHSMLQGAAGEDAMNVGDVLRFIYDLKWRMEATQSSTARHTNQPEAGDVEGGRQHMADLRSQPASVPTVAPSATGATSLQAEIDRLKALINSPQTAEYFEATRIEAAHQQERWGSEHDAGKAPEDWFWLLGYLGGKALHAFKSGDKAKGLHHIISSAASLLNWHRHVTGEMTAMRVATADAGAKTMRPGIEPPCSHNDISREGKP